MSGSTPERVTIEIDPQPGAEPDRCDIAFHGVDGLVDRGLALTLPAGRVGTWELTVTVRDTVRPGGGFLFQRHGFLLAHRVQDYSPPARDYVSMETNSAAQLRLVVNSLNQSHRPSFAQVIVTDGVLAAGDRFTLRVGDRRQGGAGSEVYDATTLGRFVLAVDRNGSGTYRTLACSPASIRITSEPHADMLRVLGPSVVAPDEPFALHLIAFDRHRNVCAQYRGTVALTAPDGASDALPPTVSFTPREQGIHILENVRLGTPGVYRFTATDEKTGLQALSNPTICQVAPERRLLWGELHCHSWGDTTLALMSEPNFKVHPARRHDQARQVGRLDFCSPGPMSAPNDEDRPEVWQAHQAAFHANDEPGTYVPFLAYEAHPGKGGDRNVVFYTHEDTHIPMKAPMDDVMAAYGGRDDVLLEAHIGGGPPNWTAYPTKEAPLLEVTSGHGAFEWVLQRALRHGYHPAVIGSSDVHLPTLGAPMAAHCFRGRFNKELNIRDSGFGSGQVAGVYAAACERQSIWQAIQNRRTFATTGARIILDVSVNGEAGGSIIESSGPVVINIRAHACAPVERVDLIRGNRCLASWLPGTLDVTHDYTDAQPLREGAYYVRLRQTDGEFAWSTPVWVTCAHGSNTPNPDLPLWNAHEPVDLAQMRPNAAEQYEAALLEYLETEEDPALFQDLTPVKLLEEAPGRSALFYAFYASDGWPVSIRWYYEFDLPRLHLDWGWRDFGARPTPTNITEPAEVKPPLA